MLLTADPDHVTQQDSAGLTLTFILLRVVGGPEEGCFCGGAGAAPEGLVAQMSRGGA